MYFKMILIHSYNDTGTKMSTTTTTTATATTDDKPRPRVYAVKSTTMKSRPQQHTTTTTIGYKTT